MDHRQARSDGRPPHLIGTEGIWTFVFIDMLIFGAIFLVYVSERLRQPEIFATSQAMLNGWFGLTNTLILLTSSWAMVGAVEAARAGNPARCQRRLLSVILFGALFCVMKAIEYWGKYRAGIGPLMSPFFTLYYFMTLLHMIHLLGAMMFLRGIRAGLSGYSVGPDQVRKVENIGLFWHFIDILWIFIFPLLYLIGLR